jgi:Na+/melibiose symporter-like transporter
MLAAFVVQGLALPMVRYFGHGDNAKGYLVTMAVLSTLAVACFVVTFLSIRERIQPDPNQKPDVRRDFTDLARNGPWITLFVLTVLIFVGYTMRAGVMVYYFKYYLGREDLFSLFNVCGLGACVTGIILCKPVSLRFGKPKTYIAGLSLTVVFQSLFLVLPPGATGLVFTVEILRYLAYGTTTPLLWTMMADVADYSEWKTGRRATGVVFSALVFGLKVGLGLGGGLGGWLLSLYGYVPNAAQHASALLGIRMTASVFPAAAFLLGVVCLFFYKIDSATNVQMTNELIERRKKYQAVPTEAAGH